MKRYLNMKTQYGVETVDELDSADFDTYAAFKKELIRLRDEYQIAGINVYISQRPTKDW